MTKIFLQINDYAITSDRRDIMVPVNQTANVIEWCDQNNIQYDTNGVYEVNGFLRFYGYYLWRIKDDEQRVLFTLRWG